MTRTPRTTEEALAMIIAGATAIWGDGLRVAIPNPKDQDAPLLGIVLGTDQYVNAMQDGAQAVLDKLADAGEEKED